jgi:hypothetical protein
MYSIAQGEYSARISNPMLTLIAITAHDLIAMGWTDGEDMFMIGHQVIEGMGTTWSLHLDFGAQRTLRGDDQPRERR